MFKDITKIKEYRDSHYQLNKDYYITKARLSKYRAKEWYHSMKRAFKCIKCGEDHPACIDFHHLDPSTKEFTVGVSYGKKGRQAILDEIAKCIPLCANCHRKLHYNERQNEDSFIS